MEYRKRSLLSQVGLLDVSMHFPVSSTSYHSQQLEGHEEDDRHEGRGRALVVQQVGGHAAEGLGREGDRGAWVRGVG